MSYNTFLYWIDKILANIPLTGDLMYHLVKKKKKTGLEINCLPYYV